MRSHATSASRSSLVIFAYQATAIGGFVFNTTDWTGDLKSEGAVVHTWHSGPRYELGPRRAVEDVTPRGLERADLRVALLFPTVCGGVSEVLCKRSL